MNSRIVNSESIFEHKKLKSNYYLSKGLVYKELIEKNSFDRLKDKVSQISNIGVNKRYYVDNKEYGVPFFSNTDLGSSNPIENCKYVSKKLCYNRDRIIEQGMTLVSAVGTIGLVAYATKEIEGAMTPIGNLIRLKSKKNPGFLYAFLKSEIGQGLINQLGSGNVQTYLDPTTFGQIPVPNFKSSKEQEIHNLIEEASNLRVEANKLLREADELFTKSLNINSKEFELLIQPVESKVSSSFVVPLSEINSISIRSRTYSERLKRIREIFNNTKNEKLVGLLEYPPVKGGRYKRVEVNPSSENAIELLNQGDIHSISPKGKIISKKHIDSIERQTAQKNMIIVPGVGTLGETEIFGKPLFVSGYLEDKVLSEHLVRIMPNQLKIPPGYLFTVLKSKLFFRVFRSLVYGTNLLYFILPILEEFPIPRLDKEVEENINKNVDLAYTNLSNAILKENQAIDLVEKEIESWQKL